MTLTDLRRLSGMVGALWPGPSERLWPESTLMAAGPLFATTTYAEAERALDELFAEGREFPPSPSIVLARAKSMAERLSEPPPDHALREPSAEELETATRRLPEVRAAIAAVAAGWTPEGRP